MTIAQRIIEHLAIADTPLTQAQIASRIGENPPSVRAACQRLARTGAIYDTYSDDRYPTYRTPAVEPVSSEPVQLGGEVVAAE